MYRKLKLKIELIVVNKTVTEICKFESVSNIGRIEYTTSDIHNFSL